MLFSIFCVWYRTLSTLYFLETHHQLHACTCMAQQCRTDGRIHVAQLHRTDGSACVAAAAQNRSQNLCRANDGSTCMRSTDGSTFLAQLEWHSCSKLVATPAAGSCSCRSMRCYSTQQHLPSLCACLCRCPMGSWGRAISLATLVTGDALDTG